MVVATGIVTMGCAIVAGFDRYIKYHINGHERFMKSVFSVSDTAMHLCMSSYLSEVQMRVVCFWVSTLSQTAWNKASVLIIAAMFIQVWNLFAQLKFTADALHV